MACDKDGHVPQACVIFWVTTEGTELWGKRGNLNQTGHKRTFECKW